MGTEKMSFEQSLSQEIARLSAQDPLHLPITEHFLRSAGLHPGMRVLDLGYGARDTALLAARLVGNEGCVVGIDSSEAKVEFCRNRAAEGGHANIRFETFDIRESRDQPFDFVFGRWVLMHCADPCEIVRAAAALAVPGEVVAFHEVDLKYSNCTSHPVAVAFEAELQKLGDVPSRYLPSPDAPARLVEIFQQAGLERPEQWCAKPTAGADPTAFCQWFSGWASKLYAYLDPKMPPLDIERHIQMIRDDILKTRSQVAGFDQWMVSAKVKRR